jgi:hypothetical protein
MYEFDHKEQILHRNEGIRKIPMHRIFESFLASEEQAGSLPI